MKKTRKNKGFTLVELIVVIAILVILAAILIPTVSGYIRDAKQATADANARTVYTAARAWLAKNYDKDASVLAGSYTNAGVLDTYLGSSFKMANVKLFAVGTDDVRVSYSDTAAFTNDDIVGEYFAGMTAD